MPNIDIACTSRTCRAVAQVFVPLSSFVEGPDKVTPGYYPTPTCAACGAPTEQALLAGSGHVQDDTLPGGPRYCHNLGDQPVWIETKSQFNRELQARGLIQAERSRYNRDDKSPWATRERLRPGRRDPFLQRS